MRPRFTPPPNAFGDVVRSPERIIVSASLLELRFRKPRAAAWRAADAAVRRIMDVARVATREGVGR